MRMSPKVKYRISKSVFIYRLYEKYIDLNYPPQLAKEKAAEEYNGLKNRYDEITPGTVNTVVSYGHATNKYQVVDLDGVLLEKYDKMFPAGEEFNPRPMRRINKEVA